ncbi:hypothetical protein D3C76_1277490 [compost metagenome]
MPGFPSGITQRDNAFRRADAIGNGEQHVLGGGQGQLAFQINGRLKTLALGVQDKTTIGLYRTADEDRHVLAERGRLDVRTQLLEDIGQVQVLRTVDHQPHGTIGRVLDDVGQGVRKVRVGHVRHGDQEVMLEVAGADVFHER